MTQGFLAVPERSIYRLRNATVPAPLLSERPPGVSVSPDGLMVVDVFVRDGLIAAVVAPETREGPEASVDLARGLVWPCLIDVHTHLDKGHTWERAANQDGTFDGAIRAVSADRTRCVQTLEPFAHAAGLDVEIEPGFSDERYLDDPEAAAARLLELAKSAPAVVR